MIVNDPAQVGDEGIDVFIRPQSLRQRGGAHKQQQGSIVRKLFYSPMVTAASPVYLKRAGVPRVIVLVWVYYSAQIVLFGAEFTNVRAKQRRGAHTAHSNEN